MSRFALPMGLLCVWLAIASPVVAVPPDRQALISSPFVDTSCGFEVDVSYPVQNEYAIAFFDQNGNVTRLVITGRLVATFTNPANGVSLTENISGPAQIDFVRGTAFGDGPGAGPVPALGSGIWLGFGRFDFVTGQTVGHFIPLCPLLAGT